jgi:YD repeat-containing protein
MADGRTRRVARYDGAGAVTGGWDVDGVPLALTWDATERVVLVFVFTGAGPFVEAWRPDGVRLWSDRVTDQFVRGLEDQLSVDLGWAVGDVGPTVLFNGEASRYDRASGLLQRAGGRWIAADGRPMRMAVLSATLLAAIEPAQQRLLFVDIARGVRATVPLTDVVPLAVAAGPVLAFSSSAGTTTAPPVVAHVLARGVERDRVGLVVLSIAPDSREVGRWAVPPALGGAPGDDAARWSIAVGADGLAFTRGVERFSLERFGPGGQHRFSVPMGRMAGTFGRRAARTRANLVSGSAALGLAAGPDGALAVLDGPGSRILALSVDGAAAGSVLQQTVLPYDVVDIASDADGAMSKPATARYFVSLADDRIRRVSAAADVARFTDPWTADCGCPLGGRMSMGGGRLWLTRPATRRVAEMEVDAGSVREVVKAGAIGLWPADIAAGEDGSVWVADGIVGRVERWRLGASEPAAAWQAGVLNGPRRLAAGRLADGTDAVAVLLADGHIEIHERAGGNLIAAFKPRLIPDEPLLADDLFITAGGSLALADAARRAVHIFAPVGAATPTPDATPNATPDTVPTRTPGATPTAIVGGGTCRVSGDKAVGPNRILLGRTAAVTLTLSVDCPGQPRLLGADVMLVLDRSVSMSGDGLAGAKAAALQFVSLLDVRVHRVGLVSFGTDIRLEAALGADPVPVANGINRLVAGGETNLGAALLATGRHMEARRRADAQPVIVLLTDGHDTVQDADPVATSLWLKGWGVQIYAVGLGESADAASLDPLATDPAHVFLAPSPNELAPIYAQIVRRVGTSGLVANLSVDDDLTPGIGLERGSAQPPALERPDGLSWGRAVLGPEGFAAEFVIRPTAAGRHAVSRSAVARWTDADGAVYAFPFPPVEIEVYVPTAVPSPTPTATPEPYRAYLPVLWRSACIPAPKPADVVLLIDTSSSMTGDKLAQAKTAAKTFVGLLDLPRDHAAVVSFDEEPRATTGLSGSLAALEAAIGSLTNGTGTRIDRALEAAHAMLATTRADPSRRAVVVLLTDGGQSGPLPPVLTAAEALRTSGTVLYAVGLGPDADLALLRTVAGPGRLFTAPTPADLAAIYAEVAAVTGCR